MRKGFAKSSLTCCRGRSPGAGSRPSPLGRPALAGPRSPGPGSGPRAQGGAGLAVLPWRRAPIPSSAATKGERIIFRSPFIPQSCRLLSLACGPCWGSLGSISYSREHCAPPSPWPPGSRPRPRSPRTRPFLFEGSGHKLVARTNPRHVHSCIGPLELASTVGAWSPQPKPKQIWK